MSGLVIGFVAHFELGNTRNYNAIQISITHISLRSLIQPPLVVAWLQSSNKQGVYFTPLRFKTCTSWPPTQDSSLRLAVYRQISSCWLQPHEAHNVILAVEPSQSQSLCNIVSVENTGLSLMNCPVIGRSAGLPKHSHSRSVCSRCPLLLLFAYWYGPHRKHRFLQFCCCIRKSGRGHVTFAEPLPSKRSQFRPV